jgi:hypothetical protein
MSDMDKIYDKTGNDYEDGRADGIAELKAALAAKQAEIDRLMKRCEKVYCAYCSFEADGGSALQFLQEHVKTCKEHPLFKALAEIDRLQEENAALKLCGTGCYCRDCNNLICGNNQSGLFKAIVFLYSTCDKWQGRK